MGDRANCCVKQDEGQIWLYTHWGGETLVEDVQRGLEKGKGRWDDESYLTRIIFNEIQGDDRGTTGFGISLYMLDNEHHVVHVDIPKQEVRIDKRSWTFAEFVHSTNGVEI